MNTRSLVIPLLVTVAACATEAETADMAQIGSRAVPAKSTRVEGGPIDGIVAEARLAELNVPRVISVLNFAPDEGRYAFGPQLVRIDECGISEGSVKLDHDIQQVNAKVGTYQDHSVERGEQEPILAVGCELRDHAYRCNSSTTTIDFKVLGLAAQVTIQNDSFGIWSGSSPAFVGAFVYSLSCRGADCGKSPASDLFGMLARPMPCTGIEAARFQK
jgi:hypothetical protein